MSRVRLIKGPSIEEALPRYRHAQADLPHFHRSSSEHQYVISGYALLRDLGTDEIHELQAGDFYSIAEGVAHVQKSRAGTRIIFFKTPGGDTKIPVEPSEDVKAWLRDLDF